MKEKLIHYICKECYGPFFIARYKNRLWSKEENRAEYCPYCGSHALFNVTFEEELGTFDRM